MIGAIIGDIIGSPYEFVPIHTKHFPLIGSNCFFTDDTVMTIAVGRALLRYHKEGTDLQRLFVEEMQALGRKYPRAGYGSGFKVWLESPQPEPYNSCGNGSAMRVSACGYYAHSLEEALDLAKASAEVSHNHPEGIKGAQATAAAVFLARTGASKDEIGGYICDNFYFLSKTLDEIRPTYRFHGSCQNTVPQAIVAFLESDSYEDAIRNTVSLGGDADTLGAITGSIAWAFYGKDGISSDMKELEHIVRSKYLPDEFLEVLDAFEMLCRNRS